MTSHTQRPFISLLITSSSYSVLYLIFLSGSHDFLPISKSRPLFACNCHTVFFFFFLFTTTRSLLGPNRSHFISPGYIPQRCFCSNSLICTYTHRVNLKVKWEIRSLIKLEINSLIFTKENCKEKKVFFHTKRKNHWEYLKNWIFRGITSKICKTGVFFSGNSPLLTTEGFDLLYGSPFLYSEHNLSWSPVTILVVPSMFFWLKHKLYPSPNH